MLMIAIANRWLLIFLGTTGSLTQVQGRARSWFLKGSQSRCLA
jgi:hypothetical protein